MTEINKKCKSEDVEKDCSSETMIYAHDVCDMNIHDDKNKMMNIISTINKRYKYHFAHLSHLDQ